MSLLSGFEVARRAMRSHQFALNVIGSNIANANTPGYSRRRAVLTTATDTITVHGSQGAGVRIGELSRMRDTTLDSLFRDHNTNAGKWFGLQQTLGRVEEALMEPTDGGLNHSLSEFWASFQELANEPESQTLRLQVRQRSMQLTQVFRRLDTHLTGLQRDLDAEVTKQVDTINSIASRLAGINKDIVSAEAGGKEATGLRDERDRLLDELSEIVRVQTSETPSGSVTVLMGSEVLVQESHARSLEVRTTKGSGTPRPTADIVWKGGNTSAAVGGGLLEGYISARSEFIDSYRADLDELAASLVTEVNALHEVGYGLDGGTGRSFFDPAKTTAATIDLSTALKTDLNSIAASSGGQEGDGNHALAIEALSRKDVMGNGNSTLAEFYAQLTGKIGMDTKEAATFLESEELLIIDIEDRRAGVSGVSIDEEMTAMLTTQHAYEAIIRVTQTIDEMIQSIINMV